MRIIYTFNDQKKARLLSDFLTNEGIENQLDVAVDTDWGSSEYSDVACKLWIYDEDKVDEALRWLHLYEQEPNNAVFSKKAPSKSVFLNAEDDPVTDVQPPGKNSRVSKQPTPVPLTAITGRITFYLILLCTVLLIYSESTSPAFAPYPATLPPTALFSSPIKKQLLYDYPHAYELVDKVVKLYGFEKLQTPAELPAEGKFLLNEYSHTSYWQGIYDPIVQFFNKGIPLQKSIDAPMFEKIREGEVWRLFTPALLHSDILHLLFNMLWVIVLGRQLEQRLGGARYILFIVLAAIFSNTAQYLMSGMNFVGFSGVICAMLTFIWVRQRRAPWEGYQLDKMTMIFMTFFILAMLSIQLVSFGMEISGYEAISPGIANTAHLSGAFCGFLLGYVPLFNWKSS